MTFKQFKSWCNMRAADGCWGALEAMTCVALLDKINNRPIWKREKFWKEEYENQVLDEIVNPIDAMISERAKTPK